VPLIFRVARRLAVRAIDDSAESEVKPNAASRGDALHPPAILMDQSRRRRVGPLATPGSCAELATQFGENLLSLGRYVRVADCPRNANRSSGPVIEAFKDSPSLFAKRDHQSWLKS